MILIINKSKKNARALSDMFYFMGVLSLGVTPKEALSEISPIYKAVIIENPDMLADKEDFVSRLRSYANIPIFAITETSSPDDFILFDSVLKSGSFASKIYRTIYDYSREHKATPPGAYELAGINASINLTLPKYLYKVLPFTKAETMILRALIRTYPAPAPSKLLLKYAFRQSRVPDISNVRTHISVMNKKFREIADRNIVIFSADEGYRILTPEILEALETV